jgi:hypothetical protein
VTGHPARRRLTWDSGSRRAVLVERHSSALLHERAAWATLAGRNPLLDGEPPFESLEAARAYLEARAADRVMGGSARRMLRLLAVTGQSV